MTAASPALLIFRVGARVLALDVGEVEGVAKRPPLTRVPHASAALAGFGAIRGRATPVIELARALSPGARASTRQAGGTPALLGGELILLRGETPVALAVDKIEGLRAAEGAERLDVARLIAEALRPRSSTPRTSTAPAARAPPQARESERSFLEFLVSGQRFALPLAVTRAVIRAAPVPVAEADPVVRGLVPYRDGVLAIVDLAQLLGLPSPDGERPVIVVGIGAATVGLSVERVLGALRLPGQAVAPAPAIFNRGAGEARIAEIARAATGLVAVLAADRLFDAETTSRLTALAPAVAARPHLAEQDEDAVVLFRLGGERYALPAEAVEAVARAPAQLSPPPGAPPFLAGVMSHRGGMFPLIDLGARFGARAVAPRAVIFLRDREIPAGLLVDAVERLTHLPREATPPLAGDAGALFRQAAIPDGVPLLVADAAALLGQARRDLIAWGRGAAMIRLLTIDDSALMRRLLADLFAEQGDFEVEAARDGQEALARLAAFAPDVITLDLQMPGLDGLACLDRIMIERPTPVVVVSSLARDGADDSLRALELGAVEVVPKPSGALSLKMESFGPVLVEAVRAAAQARVSKARRLVERVRRRFEPLAPRRAARKPGAGLVLIGCSTGGPAALDAVLSALPESFPWPVVVAQHMPAAFTGALARRLDRLCALSVREVTHAMLLRPGEVYIGRGDADVIIAERPGGLAAVAAPPEADSLWRPSVDRLVDSALALAPAAGIVGVLMTGMGHDGAAAMARLRAAGGRTIAEAESTAVIWGMPGVLVRSGGAEFVEPLDRIGPRLVELAP